MIKDESSLKLTTRVEDVMEKYLEGSDTRILRPREKAIENRKKLKIYIEKIRSLNTKLDELFSDTSSLRLNLAEQLEAKK